MTYRQFDGAQICKTSLTYMAPRRCEVVYQVGESRQRGDLLKRNRYTSSLPVIGDARFVGGSTFGVKCVRNDSRHSSTQDRRKPAFFFLIILDMHVRPWFLHPVAVLFFSESALWGGS